MATWADGGVGREPLEEWKLARVKPAEVTDMAGASGQGETQLAAAAWREGKKQERLLAEGQGEGVVTGVLQARQPPAVHAWTSPSCGA